MECNKFVAGVQGENQHVGVPQKIVIEKLIM